MLIFILVIFPVGFLPTKFASLMRRLLDRTLIRKGDALRDRQRGGYRFFGESFGFYLFFPTTVPEEFVEGEGGNDDVCNEYYAFQLNRTSRIAFRLGMQSYCFVD